MKRIDMEGELLYDIPHVLPILFLRRGPFYEVVDYSGHYSFCGHAMELRGLLTGDWVNLRARAVKNQI